MHCGGLGCRGGGPRAATGTPLHQEPARSLSTSTQKRHVLTRTDLLQERSSAHSSELWPDS